MGCSGGDGLGLNGRRRGAVQGMGWVGLCKGGGRGYQPKCKNLNNVQG